MSRCELVLQPREVMIDAVLVSSRDCFALHMLAVAFATNLMRKGANFADRSFVRFHSKRQNCWPSWLK